MIGQVDTSALAGRSDPSARLIRAARRGEGEALGRLLESYRNYLHLLASMQIDRRLQVRVSPSDLVQDTMLGAYRDFDQFRGENERQLLAWLRQILINRLHVVVQQHILAEKRGLRREVSLHDLGELFDQSTANLAGAVFADKGPSPSADLLERERAVVLADQLAQMPPQYREVIVLRNLQGLSFEEVARQTGRTSGAVRMLWLRAIKRLRDSMEPCSEDQD
jgi:RNA polymerase sigma-70 factor (ECF subfamily)